MRSRFFFRRLRLSEFFNTEKNTSVSHPVNSFRKPSKWVPSVNRDKYLESYISVVEEEILYADKKPFHKNVSKLERMALLDLKRHDDIVIKEADKGSAVVVLDKSLYSKSPPLRF